MVIDFYTGSSTLDLCMGHVGIYNSVTFYNVIPDLASWMLLWLLPALVDEGAIEAPPQIKSNLNTCCGTQLYSKCLP